MIREIGPYEGILLFLAVVLVFVILSVILDGVGAWMDRRMGWPEKKHDWKDEDEE